MYAMHAQKSLFCRRACVMDSRITKNVMSTAKHKNTCNIDIRHEAIPDSSIYSEGQDWFKCH